MKTITISQKRFNELRAREDLRAARARIAELETLLGGLLEDDPDWDSYMDMCRLAREGLKR